MGSNKQRVKQAKGQKVKVDDEDVIAVPARESAQQASTGETDRDSPFLRMPREVRDKIYDELLIARLKPEDQAKYDQVKSATNTPFGDFGKDNALDYFEQDICLMPGGNRGYPFIMDALGLLLANKQIHEEANETLFSKNLFLVLVEWERVFPFWRCNNAGCRPPGLPCFIMFENFKKIKHLYIIVANKRAISDPMLNVESKRLEANLKTVVWCFRNGGNRLRTLKIRYTSCWDGQVEALRGEVEGELPEGMPDRAILIQDCHGKNHGVKRGEAKDYLFKHCHVLDPLRQLKDVGEDVKIRGDLPQAYMDELTKILSVPDAAPAVKKRQMEDEAERKRNQETKKDIDFHGFMKKMADKYESTDPEQAKWYRDQLTVEVMSPAIIAELMKPPSKEYLETLRNRDRTPEGSDDSLAEDAVNTSNGTDGNTQSGGIGLLDGKPVFGPARPPQAT